MKIKIVEYMIQKLFHICIEGVGRGVIVHCNERTIAIIAAYSVLYGSSNAPITFDTIHIMPN